MGATKTKTYLGGWLQQGYMPEVPFARFSSAQAAMAYVLENMSAHHDQDCAGCLLDEDMTPLREQFDIATEHVREHGQGTYGSYTYYVEAEDE